MRNLILKKVLTFALVLTLVITMAPVIPGAVARANAADEYDGIIQEVDLTYDTTAIRLNTAYTEGELEEIILDNINVSNQGIFIDESNSRLMYIPQGMDNFRGIGDGTSQVDVTKTYYLRYHLLLDPGYDWSSADKENPGAALEVTVNGSEITGDAIFEYISSRNGIMIYIPMGAVSTTPIIKDVIIEDGDVSVERGGTYTFSGYATGTLDIDTISWSIEGNGSEDTKIVNIMGRNMGTLEIAEDEPADVITVTATSRVDINRYATIQVTVVDKPPVIESVTVTPSDSVMYPGDKAKFSAEVTGTQVDKSVTWTVEGAQDVNTVIDENGNLTIGVRETAERITVTATANRDNTKTDSVSVEIGRKIEIDRVEIAYDAKVIDLDTKWTEGEVDDRVVDSISESTTGINIDKNNSGLTYVLQGMDVIHGIGTGTSQVDVTKAYYIEYNLTLESGYDWVIASKEDEGTGIVVMANGENVTSNAKFKYNDGNNIMSIYVPIKIVDNTPLDTPTNVKVNNIASSGKPKVTWDAVEGADKYNVYRATSADGTYSYLGSTSNTHYTNTGAKAGTTYYYKVEAADSANEAKTSEMSSRCHITCDLAQPSNVKVNPVASSGKPKVSWNAVDGAVKYYVYRSTSKDGTYSYLGSTSNTHYTNTGAKAGTTYYYKVKAVISESSAANSAQSSYCYMTCDLAAPSNVKVSNVASSGKPKVTWSAVDGAVKYYVYRSTSKNGTYSYLGSTANTSYTNTGAVAGTTYYYKVKAVISESSAANSAQSSSCYITCDLAKPTGVKVALSSGKPKVSWTAVSGADKYYVYRATSANGTYSYLGSTTKTSYTNTGAKSGTKYYYKVKAVKTSNENGNSAQSSYVSITSK